MGDENEVLEARETGKCGRPRNMDDKGKRALAMRWRSMRNGGLTCEDIADRYGTYGRKVSRYIASLEEYEMIEEEKA